MGLKDQIEQEAIGPKRDRWGRPLLVPASGHLRVQADASGKTWYSRASSLSDYASGVKTGLETWKRRLAVVGVARNEHVAAMIAGLPDMDTGDKKGDAVTKAQVDEHIETALSLAGASAKADWGTAVHSFTAEGNLEHAPERMKADIAAYHACLERLGITPLMDEVFVANDVLRAAGTFDHLYRLPDGRVVVGDKKTGIEHMLDSAIQMGTYSHSDVYDWRTDERTPLADVAGSFGNFDPSVGLYVHIPRGEARCEMKLLDLEYGHTLGDYCASLRDAGLAAVKEDLLDTSFTGLLLMRIQAVGSKAELKKVMDGVTDDDALFAARTRWAELTD